jgi:quercetin dioxygenase-like cupin family protein
MPDAPTAAPELYRVVAENDRVRILEYKSRPGQKSAPHSHPALIAFAVRGGKVRFTSGDGETAELTLEDGQAVENPPQDHTSENVGNGELHIILVEMK